VYPSRHQPQRVTLMPDFLSERLTWLNVPRARRDTLTWHCYVGSTPVALNA
jgi:hypothetical protein